MGITKFPHGILATPNLGGAGRLADMWGSDLILFVDGVDGSDSNDGLTPTSAYSTISAPFGSSVTTLASNGTTIYVRPKFTASTFAQTYYSESINVDHCGISIIGAGNGTPATRYGVEVKPTTAGIGDHLIDVQAPGLTLENLRLTLTGGTAAAGKSIVYAVASSTVSPSGLTVRGCRFENDKSHPEVSTAITGAIALGSMSYSVIENNIFWNCLGGVTFQNSYGSGVNNQVRFNVFSGITTNVDCYIIWSMNDASSAGHCIYGNMFADGLPAHSGGGTLRFIAFPYVTAGTGILADNYFACADQEAQFGETGTQALIADNFYNPGNWCEGSSNTAPYGIITT